MEIDLTLDAGRLAGALARVVVFFAAAYVVTRTFIWGLGCSPRGLVCMLFDLNREMNFPSIYSGAALLLAALLLALTCIGESRAERPCFAWGGLALAFVFLSADELFSFHEKLNGPLRESLHTSGMFHHAWVIPYSVVTALMGVVYLRFLRRLPKRTSRFFILAGLIYVGGTVGCEMIGNAIQESPLGKGPALAVEILIEETMEMSGVVLFIYAVVAYIQAELSGLVLRVGFSRSSSEKD